MSHAPKILAFAGSTREASFNKSLVKLAMEGARAAGAEVTYLDLRDLSLPLFDEDLEARDGPPPGARKLKELLFAHQGFLISSPEYNSSVSGALKNAIDWASRPAPGEATLQGFDGKLVALMSASPGALGGLRGLVHLRAILGNIRVLLLPDQVVISKANEAFSADRKLKDSKQQASVEALGAKLVSVLRKLHP